MATAGLELSAQAAKTPVRAEAAISSMEVAYRMQTEAPEVFDIRKESKATLEMYGPGSTARSCLMAVRLVEKGVRMVHVHGATDDFGFKAIEKPVHVHDLHATILHLLGIDHTKLTYRYSGRDFRLTDVSGNVIKEILA
jgi:Protein of unknown function (DUF1501)